MNLVADLITELERFFAAHAYLPQDGPLLLALWAPHTWVFDVFEATPYLLFESATPGCGKTTVLELLRVTCAGPRLSTAMTEAVVFRLIEKEPPTFLIDEAEILAGSGERSEAIRAAIRAGYKRGITVPRCVGKNHDVKDFKIFCPKAFASVGGLRGALLDRCIVLHLEKSPIILASMREKDVKRVSEPLRRKLESFAATERPSLLRLYEAEPPQGYWPQFRNREAELFDPLLLIAKHAGPAIESRAIAAAEAFCKVKAEILNEEEEFMLHREMAEELDSMSGPDFSATEIANKLKTREAWQNRFSGCHGNQFAVRVGHFLRTFRIDKRTLQGRTRYTRTDAIQKLRAHLPQQPHPTPPTSPATTAPPTPPTTHSPGSPVGGPTPQQQVKVVPVISHVNTAGGGVVESGGVSAIHPRLKVTDRAKWESYFASCGQDASQNRQDSLVYRLESCRNQPHSSAYIRRLHAELGAMGLAYR